MALKEGLGRLCSEDCSIGFSLYLARTETVSRESVFTADEQSMDITSAPAVQAGSLCHIAPAPFDRRGKDHRPWTCQYCVDASAQVSHR